MEFHKVLDLDLFRVYLTLTAADSLVIRRELHGLVSELAVKVFQPVIIQDLRLEGRSHLLLLQLQKQTARQKNMKQTSSQSTSQQSVDPHLIPVDAAEERVRLDVCEAHLDLTPQPVLGVLEEQEQQSWRAWNQQTHWFCWTERLSDCFSWESGLAGGG